MEKKEKEITENILFRSLRVRRNPVRRIKLRTTDAAGTRNKPVCVFQLKKKESRIDHIDESDRVETRRAFRNYPRVSGRGCWK